MSQPHNPIPVHVAVGIVCNSQDQILIARRPDHLHQGGLWEFPGGKIEPGETVQRALSRELYEEIGIQVHATEPLITIPHNYGDKQVFLDVHMVREYSGEAHGREGQPIQWVQRADLRDFEFPAANRPILNALTLPDQYMITGAFADEKEAEVKLKHAIQRGIRLVQLRVREYSDEDTVALARRLLAITQGSATRLLINGSVAMAQDCDAHGVHFTGTRLRECTARPISHEKLFSVSCHTLDELQHAACIEADLALLSPVLPTQSHPGEPSLGWERFTEMVRQCPIPVYALGGMSPSHLSQARAAGAQGIAAIGALWEAS